MQAVGTKANLTEGFFAADVNGLAAAHGERVANLQEQRGFSNAGIAANEDGGPGDDSATEDTVELADAGWIAPGAVGSNVVERRRDGLVGGGKDGAVQIFADVGDGLLGEAVPLAAVGALAHPFGLGASAVGADELGVSFGHLASAGQIVVLVSRIKPVLKLPCRFPGASVTVRYSYPIGHSLH